MNKRIQAFFVIALLSLSICNAQNPNSNFNPGDIVPNFTGTDQFNKPFELYSTLEKGPVVLIFYRGYWCPYCNKQLSQLEDSLNFITQKGGTVIAVTPEQPEGIEKTIKKTGSSFKIIHDKDLKIMNLYKVGFSISESLNKQYQKHGIYVERNNGSNGPNLPVPATYIIGKDQKVLYTFYDPDYRKRATVGKILDNL
ncbi:peroxiredoxin-like family protein [Reichenbachiella versicolor]|uniref:peroxiredoxin-like family protein n=1 Tax=Reichenbachiella versicolor TaxID=1821036 RepID=UPI0013A5A317|nr:peroxiredoxin-like family protein [Reichenbachiella versicolor]